MGLKEIETPNAMISYFAEQLGPLIEKSEIKQPTYLSVSYTHLTLPTTSRV